MNTYNVDMGTHCVAVHTTEPGIQVCARNPGKGVSLADYSDLSREFKRGRRFVRWENGHAEIVRAK